MYELMPCVFHPAQSFYEGSHSDLEYLERRCKEMSVQLNVDYSYIQEPEQRIVDTSTKFEYKTKPYDYQVVGVEFGMEHARFANDTLIRQDEFGGCENDGFFDRMDVGNKQHPTAQIA